MLPVRWLQCPRMKKLLFGRSLYDELYDDNNFLELNLGPKTTFSGDYKLVAIINGLKQASCFHSYVFVKCYRIDKATGKKTCKYGNTLGGSYHCIEH